MREIEYSPVTGLLSLTRLIEIDRNGERTRLGYRNYKAHTNGEAPAELLLLISLFLSRSRRIEGDEDFRWEAEIKAFVVDTHTPYTRTKPIHLRRLISPSPPLLAPGVVGKVLFSNKNLTNMPRFAEEWRRSAPSSRFPPWRNIKTYSLLTLAMAEAKGDTPVISAFNYAPHIQHIISPNSNISLLHNGRDEKWQAWKDFVRLLGGPEASSHHCLIYFVKQSCRQFNGPNYIKLGTA
ncbi:hypothetical protein ALC53_12750 [Atta colombica]|uniref:Uncharacterized protein n=1 Tax=Atta colombica TaxID=520822 RepID=A0A195AXE4_9HYME|nr:hypothetical protein ALC53_12750 [Atta colombica]